MTCSRLANFDVVRPEMSALIACGAGYKLLPGLEQIADAYSFVLQNFVILSRSLNIAIGTRNALLVDKDSVVSPNIVTITQLHDLLYDIATHNAIHFTLYPALRPLMEALAALSDAEMNAAEDGDGDVDMQAGGPPPLQPIDPHPLQPIDPPPLEPNEEKEEKRQQDRITAWRKLTTEMRAIVRDDDVLVVFKGLVRRYWNFLFSLDRDEADEDEGSVDITASHNQLIAYLQEFSDYYSRTNVTKSSVQYDAAQGKIENMDALITDIRGTGPGGGDTETIEGVNRRHVCWSVQRILVHAGMLIVDSHFYHSQHNLYTQHRRFRAKLRVIFENLNVSAADYKILKYSFQWVQGARQLLMANAPLCAGSYYIFNKNHHIILNPESISYEMFVRWLDMPDEQLPEHAAEILNTLQNELDDSVDSNAEDEDGDVDLEGEEQDEDVALDAEDSDGDDGDIALDAGDGGDGGVFFSEENKNDFNPDDGHTQLFINLVTTSLANYYRHNRTGQCRKDVLLSKVNEMVELVHVLGFMHGKNKVFFLDPMVHQL